MRRRATKLTAAGTSDNTNLRRCAPTACPSGRGSGVQMTVDWVSKLRGIRSSWSAYIRITLSMRQCWSGMGMMGSTRLRLIANGSING